MNKKPWKTNYSVCRVEKKLNRKGDKMYVKWKGYDNSFNSLIKINDIL